MRRLMLVIVLALGLTAVPLAAVHACSCAMMSGPEEVVAQAARDGGVAFIGTVVDVAPARADPGAFGGVVGYAFAVEHASAPISATMIEVRALGGDGGASCGFTFERGERWFVGAYEQDGALHTGLCSGNTRMTDLAQGDADRLREILFTVAPPVDPPGEAGTSLTFDWVAVAGAISLVGAILLTVFAFRRDSARRPG